MYTNNVFGSFYHGKSLMHDINPSIKLICFLISFILMCFTNSIVLHLFIGVLVILMILIYCFIKKDSYTAILVASIAVYTIVEAHFVSDYIGRNFILLIIGALWSEAFYISKGQGRYLCVIKTDNL